MKYLFSLLLGLVILFPAYSQEDSLTCIKPQTARYFLEADDERWVLRVKDTLNTELITTLNETVLVKDKIIETYKADSVSYKIQAETLEAVSTLKQQRIDKLERQVRTRKTLEILGLVLASLLIIL